MTTYDDASLEQVAEALAGAPRRAVTDVDDLPAKPGLYAFWPGTPEAVARLGLNEEGASQPLYIGLARKSLSRRVGEYLHPAHEPAGGRYLSPWPSTQTALPHQTSVS